MLLVRRSWPLLLAVACSGSDGGKPFRTTYQDEGSICIRSAADGKIEVTVVFPTCLSSSCDRALGTTCSATLSGTTLVISSKGESESTGARECTADCGALVAKCGSSIAVPPGDYTLEHGDSSAAIVLPQSEVALFTDSASFPPCSG